MTEKQYANLMYALSTIIAMGQEKPMPVPGIDYNDVVKMHETNFNKDVKKVFKYLMGNPGNTDFIMQEMAKKANKKLDNDVPPENESIAQFVDN